MTLDIHSLMRDLSQSRPIFHSEADFQHALAWQIHEAIPDSQIRLEYPFRYDGNTMKLDIWLRDKKTAIELKYLPRKLETEHNGEQFLLKNQDAHGEGCYDFLKDVERLERKAGDHKRLVHPGLAVLLTNDPLYWDCSRGSATSNYVGFRVFESREVTGVLAWPENARTEKKREAPIRLEGSYTMHWQDYSNFAGEEYGKFRYLAVEVHCQQATA